MSNVSRIQIANEGVPGQTERNLYIEGEKKGYEVAVKMVNEIVEKHKQLKSVSNIIGFS